MTKTSRSARKANRTRRAREAFRKAYPETADIAEDLLRGATPADFWDVHGAAAVLANLHRPGRYAVMAEACNF